MKIGKNNFHGNGGFFLYKITFISAVKRDHELCFF